MLCLVVTSLQCSGGLALKCSLQSGLHVILCRCSRHTLLTCPRRSSWWGQTFQSGRTHRQTVLQASLLRQVSCGALMAVSVQASFQDHGQELQAYEGVGQGSSCALMGNGCKGLVQARCLRCCRCHGIACTIAGVSLKSKLVHSNSRANMADCRPFHVRELQSTKSKPDNQATPLSKCTLLTSPVCP